MLHPNLALKTEYPLQQDKGGESKAVERLVFQI